MTYYVYHIPGVKVGCTTNLQRRVTDQQGYSSNEYEVLLKTKDIHEASVKEQTSQLQFGYKKDLKLYKNLFKKRRMKKHSSSPATTTFKVPKPELNASFLADLEIKTQYGNFKLDSSDKIDWIISNAVSSQFGPSTCYIYNKAMANAGEFETLTKEKLYSYQDQFELIREWAKERGLYNKGDIKTQLIKLYEESGELSQAILKDDKEGIIDAIGDSVVVLTNLAHLVGTNIEDCIGAAYNEISNRTGRMINGTFVKDER
jgi:NTP pyrophosphatase (non-canonical NTP hydrolase)